MGDYISDNYRDIIINVSSNQNLEIINLQKMNTCTSQKTWGLYDKSSHIAVPLKSLHAYVSIVNTLSRVKYTQNYFNDSDKIIETEFFFPISSGACFDSFEAAFNDTTIRGMIKKKEQAQEEYKEAMMQGRTAAYSEINEETGDIMKIMIGNIPPKTTVAITYSYIQKLEVAANKFLCFRLFSTITPRYNGNIQEALKSDITLLSSYPTISSQDPQAYPLTIETDIQSASPITFVKSPSHDIIPVLGNENHTCAVTFKSNEPQYPKKDFILLYTTENKPDRIESTLTPFEEGYCAMIHVRADFQTSSNEKVYERLVKAKEIESEYSMDEVKGEFIFLIDRSGSMGGQRIKMARESLILFLSSLPQDSFFNIVSFGSSYQFLYGSSQKYSQDSLEQSVRFVESFEADLGGTEIYDALRNVFHEPMKTGYPRSIFLLTDGAVSNTSQVLNLIKENNKKSKVFTIGIGNGCSQELITQGAACGHGKHEFVADNNEVYEKVISLLNASLSPCYSDISLESDNFDAVVKALTPNPVTIPLLLDGQTLTFFLFLRPEAFTNENKMVLKLNMNDSRSNQRRSIGIILDTDQAMQNELIPKLAVHDMIRRLETDSTSIVWMAKKDIKQTLLELSLKHGVLCKETAFFCETEKSNVKTIQETEKMKIVIPTILSQDYSSKGIPPNSNKTQKIPLPPQKYLKPTLPPSYIKNPKIPPPSSQNRPLIPQGFCSPNLVSSGSSNKNQRIPPPPQKCMNLTLSSDIKNLKIHPPSSQNHSLIPQFDKKSEKISSDPVSSRPLLSTDLESLMYSNPTALSMPMGSLPNAPQKSFQQRQVPPPSFVMKENIEFKPLEEKKEKEQQVASDFKVLSAYEAESFFSAPTRSFPIPRSMIYSSSNTSKTQNISVIPNPVSSSESYLQVVKKQKFEGFWDPQDSFIHQTILKKEALPEVPEQIQNIDAELAQTIWLTLLVLLWLEVTCQKDRKAWLLIYQKGVSWLKRVGVNYEDTKNLGSSKVKA